MDQQAQWQFFYEIFDASLPRLGPGDGASTLRALRTLLNLRATAPGGSPTEGLRILDIGCGNGAQTLDLARTIDGTIVAVDNHQPFLDELERRARGEGLLHKIELRHKDMGALGDEDGTFDLVWAEGCLFVVGFEPGLKICFDRLEPGGLAAVSELAWLRPDPPAECREFFEHEYPAMADAGANERLIAASGLELVDRFVQPESAWWEPYYGPLGERVQHLRTKYRDDRERLAMLDGIQAEIETYRAYSAFYGNVFYLLRRPRE
jgi:SAM-dependent methyltransferase